MPTGFPDMRGNCAAGRAMAKRSLEGGGEERRGDTPITCQAGAEMGYLRIGRDVKKEDGGSRGVWQERMKGLRHEREADMG